MNHSIRTLYVVHHSHTDIGYTDLQERVVQAQVDYIRSALRLLADPKNEAFRWNCETWFCAEQFLQQAAPAEREAFFAQMRAGRLGFSANYLNFCDLADSAVLGRRLDEVCALLNANGITPKTASRWASGTRCWTTASSFCTRTSTATMVCTRCTKTRPPTGGKAPPASGCWCGTASTITWATCWG